MKKIFRFSFSVVLLFVFAPLAFGQTSAKIENELVGAIKEVQKYSNYGENRDEDKLYKANEAFEKMLLRETKNAATLKYNFPKLGDLVVIATSEDGKFRAYSWDLGTGGTMHDYATVYQYQGANGKVYSRTDKFASAAEEDETGGGSFVNSIYAVMISTGTVYVVCTTFIGSTIDHYGAADLYQIEGDRLNDKVKLFKTKQGLTNSIGFEYENLSVENHDEIPLRLIRYDKATKTIKIPVIIADKTSPNGRVTNRFISYRFDGKYFVRN